MSYSIRLNEKKQQDINGTTQYSINQMNCAIVRKSIMTTFTSKWFKTCLQQLCVFFNTIKRELLTVMQRKRFWAARRKPVCQVLSGSLPIPQIP